MGHSYFSSHHGLHFFPYLHGGGLLSGFLEDGISALTDFMAAAMSAQLVAKPLQSLILDGALAGVGTIITFLPIS